MNGVALGLSEAEQAEYDQLAAEAEYAETMLSIEAETEVRELGWAEMRREIMRRGGIASGPYTRHWLPGQVYRVNGAAPDVLAADMRDEGWGTWEDADGFLAQLWVLWESFKAQQAARTRQSRSVDLPTETVESEESDAAVVTEPARPELRVLSVDQDPASVGARRRYADLPLYRLPRHMVSRRRPGFPAARRGRARAAPPGLSGGAAGLDPALDALDRRGRSLPSRLFRRA